MSLVTPDELQVQRQHLVTVYATEVSLQQVDVEASAMRARERFLNGWWSE